MATEETPKVRTEKQIAWSKELGKRSKALKEHKNKITEKSNYTVPVALAAAGVLVVYMFRSWPTSTPVAKVAKVEQIAKTKTETPRHDIHTTKQIPTVLQMK